MIDGWDIFGVPWDNRSSSDVTFYFAINIIEAAVERARRGGRKRVRKPDDRTERGGGRKKENEEEEIPTLTKYLSIGSIRIR